MQPFKFKFPNFGKKFIRKTSIRLRNQMLIAFVLIALVPMVILGTWNYHATRQELIVMARQSLESAASQTAANLDGFIRANFNAIATGSQLPTLVNYLQLAADNQLTTEKTQQALRVLKVLQASDRVFIASYSLINLEGKNILDTNQANIGTSESSYEYFQQALETGESYVSSIKFLPTDSKPYIYFSHSVRNPDTGKVIGVLRSQYSAAILQQLILTNTNLAGDLSFPILLDENFIRLAQAHRADGSVPHDILFQPITPLSNEQITRLKNSDRLPPTRVQPIRPLPEFAAGLAQTSGSQKYFNTTLADNPNVIYAAATQRMQTQPWIIVFVRPRAIFLSPMAKNTKVMVLMASITIIVVILIALKIANQLSEPIVVLTRFAKKLAQANWSEQTIITSTMETSHVDEIAVLAKTFNQMAQQLQTSFTLQEKNNAELETRVKARTEELSLALKQLQRTQTQMVQNEKMLALGQMVAGVAHEINNPVSFIHGNLMHLDNYTQDLLKLIEVYQEYYPNPPQKLQDFIDEIELDFIKQDFSKVITSMSIGTRRIKQIVLSLRSFSRLDEAEFKESDLHESLNNTLMILHHRIKAKLDRPEIEVIKEYGHLPLVNCYAGQLNQVFMNILSNAIDALEESFHANKTNAPTIWIHTELTEKKRVRISITDNGIGIPENIHDKLFDPFFTTKPVGKGTGLGLSISYQIIVEKHKGKLWYDSRFQKGTKFIIEIPV